MTFPAIDWIAVLPLLLVACLGVVCLGVGLFVDDDEVLGWGALVGLGVTFITTAVLIGQHGSAFNGTLVLDGYALFFDLLILAVGCVVVLMSMSYVEETGIGAGESYALLLFALSGMIVMASATDMILIFLGLEVMSISVYILAGAWRTQMRSNEAAMKYFLLGAFATGFLLYGIALIYGATGATRIDVIADKLGGVIDRHLLLAGVAMLLVAFGFKVAAVPFHVWTPDVYEGAPTSVTALMAVGVKAAGFAAFARVFLDTLAPISSDWNTVLWWLAAATMTVGNLLAITQANIKRMLAYSSIAHAGYLLVAMVAGGKQAGAALLFYLLAYAAMNLGAFGVVVALARRGEPNEEIERYAGLGFRRPLLAMAMAAFMLS